MVNLLHRRNTAPPRIANHTPTRHAIRRCMLRLWGGRKPSATRYTLLFDEAAQNVFCDDEQMFDSREARVFFRGAAVHVRPTRRIVLDDGGANFARRSRCEGEDVEKAIRTVYRSGVRCGCHLSATQCLYACNVRGNGWARWLSYPTPLLLCFPKSPRCPCPPSDVVSDWLSVPVTDSRSWRFFRASGL